MIKQQAMLLLTIISINSYATTTESINKVQRLPDLTVKPAVVNKTVNLTITSTYSSDITITNIAQYTNNGVACAVSSNEYAVKPNVPQALFPFSSKDQSNCFSQVYIFKQYNNGNYPTLVGFYDKEVIAAKFGGYLTDWGAYIATPVVFKITYKYQNIINQKGVVKYFVYKVNE